MSASEEGATSDSGNGSRRRFRLGRRRKVAPVLEEESASRAISRADLHMHSRYSDDAADWFMRRIGCAESYTPPQVAYDLARKRGMQFVTLTDHDRIDGALEIAHLPGAFVSEEVTTFFPEDGCKLHVVTLHITPRQHEEMQEVRASVYDLADYLHQNDVAHYIAHPLYPNNRRMSVENVEKLLLLFNVFEEINGHHTAHRYLFFKDVLDGLTPELLEELADKHGIEPHGPEPWKKGRTGGSDDHGMLCIGTTWTETKRVDTAEEFVAEIVGRRSRAGGEHGTSRKLAHAIYSVGYGYYREEILGDDKSRSFVPQMVDRLLERHPAGPNSSLNVVLKLLGRRIRKGVSSRESNPVLELFKRESKDFFVANPGLRRRFLMGKPIEEKHELMYRFANHVANGIVYEYTRKLVDELRSGNLYEIFQTVSALGAVHLFLSPYYISYNHVQRDNPYLRRVRRRFLGEEPEGSERIALFTDTLTEVHSVVALLDTLRSQARVQDRSLTVLTAGQCMEEPGSDLVSFDPIGIFPMPEYSELKLNVPPLLEILDYCEQQVFDVIHAVTPGPVGVSAILVARMFNLPLIGSYHADLPGHVMQLTNDKRLRDLTWRYIRWFYGQMDKVLVPSESSRRQLLENGFEVERIEVIPQGVDLERFAALTDDSRAHQEPARNGHARLLYVGRVAKDRNLDQLLESFVRLHRSGRNDLELVIVGDGPYRKALQREYAEYPVRFRTWPGERELAEIYASSDLFVLPSRVDVTGHFVLEAQAAGLPAVVTDQGGAKECVIPDVTGRVYAGEQEGSLTHAIDSLLQDPETRREMGRKARAHMESRTHESAFRSFWRVHEKAVREG